MDSEKSRKIIVAAGMAAVIGIGVVAFALTHHPASTAQLRPPLASVPPTRNVPAAVAPIPGAPASAVAPKPAPSVETVSSSLPAVDQRMGRSTELAASDGQITTDVKSQLAADSLSKDVNIGVSTTDGVVTLTGTVTNQTAIDHVKDVAGRVKDVKSVDTSALVLASL